MERNQQCIRKETFLATCIVFIHHPTAYCLLKHENVHTWTLDQTTYLICLVRNPLHVAGRGAITMSFCTLWGPRTKPHTLHLKE